MSMRCIKMQTIYFYIYLSLSGYETRQYFCPKLKCNECNMTYGSPVCSWLFLWYLAVLFWR